MNNFEGPASAGPSRVRRVAALVGVALLLGGCAVGGGGDDEEFGALPDDKAVAAQPLTAVPSETAITVPGTTGRPGGPTTTTGRGGTTTTTPARGSSAGASSGGATTTTAPGAVPYNAKASVADRTGDAGLQARPYGDLTLLRLEDNGTRGRFTVQVAGDLPQPAEGEVIGIGVDLFRTDDEESDYQLFALGNADGWRAGLQQSSEWVEFPGTFELGGNTIVFTVPWSAIGGRRPGSMSVFADWSKARLAVVADASADHAPDRGAQSFSP